MRLKSLADKSYTDPYWRVSLQLAFWGMMFASNYYFQTIAIGGIKENSANLLISLKSTVSLMAFYYALVYLAVPRLFLQKRMLAGILFMLALFFLYALADAWGDQQIINNCAPCSLQLTRENPAYYRFLHLPLKNIIMARVFSLGLLYELIILLSLPVAIKIGRSYFRQTVQKLELAKDNLQLEFNFLKSQVNPHFLFNTLNNIYSLVIHDKKQQAADTIARLSGFMRYTLYECNEDKIPLEKEIRLLWDYIELEQIRLNCTRVRLNYKTDSNGYLIPPLLIMPALENAFKFSSDHSAADHIELDIEVSESHLKLEMRNSFDPAKTGNTGGIGLQNLQKRLQHHYAGRYTYSAGISGNIYILALSCTLT